MPVGVCFRGRLRKHPAVQDDPHHGKRGRAGSRRAAPSRARKLAHHFRVADGAQCGLGRVIADPQRRRPVQLSLLRIGQRVSALIGPLSAITRANNPNIVTFAGLPPNLAVFCCTQRKTCI